MLSCNNFYIHLFITKTFHIYTILYKLATNKIKKTIKLRTFKVDMLSVILWQYIEVARCPYATLLVIVVVLVAVSPV